MPKVSLIMPCYNAGRFLIEAVDSARAQTFGDFELLIVDDGSDDAETRALLHSIAEPRTRVLEAPHRGVTSARNLALAEAKGELVSFFDADDRMHPECLRRAVETLDAEPSLGFVSFWVRLFGDEEWDWRPEGCDLLTLLHDCSVATAAVVRREAVVAVGGFDQAMELGHEDWDLWLTLVERGYRGTILPEVLFYYRRRAHSRSTVADRGGTYLELYRERMRKHADSYRAHAFETIWRKEAAIGHQLHAVADARGSALAGQERLDRARAGLAAAERAHRQELEAALARAHDEIRALRASWSWKITGPLRRVASRLKP